MDDIHWTELSIDNSDIDSYGHLNNAAYMSLFETARWVWLESMGIPRSSLEKENMGPVVLCASLKFKKELKAGERVRISTQIVRFRSPLFDVDHSILGNNHEVFCTANYRLGFFDLTKRKLTTPSITWMKAFERYKK